MTQRTWTPAQAAPEWEAMRAGFKTGPQDGTGRRVIFDIEGDGLLHAQGAPGSASYKPEGTELWCIGAIDVATEEKFYWGVDLEGDPADPTSFTPNLPHALRFLSQCDMTLAHHGIGYDYPYIARWAQRNGIHWKPCPKAWDSEVIAKVVWPYDVLVGPDLARIRAGMMPGHMLKRHGLAAWGYRTGTHKVDYSGGFHEWSPAMAVYLMTGDLDGPLALWRLIEKRTAGWANPELTFEVENETARIVFEQGEHGVRFDMPRAVALASELANEKARIEKRLVEVFGSWWAPLDDPEVGRPHGSTQRRQLREFPDVTIPRRSEKTGKELKPYVGPPLEEATEGDHWVRIERTTFNPSSRDHLGQRLQEVYGWKPKKFSTETGKPTVDESVLGEIPDAVMPADIRQLVLDYFVVSKTLGTLSKGKKSWIGMAAGPTTKDPWHIPGRVHGEMDTCGAVTRRGTHKNPNLSGTPKVRKDKITKAPLVGLAGRYGLECRELFCADDGWEQTGIDASSLELIDLGHYLHPLDGGAFSERVCDPKRDAHEEHATMASEVAGNPVTRDDAKTTIYLKVYGGSAYKLSLDPAIIVKPEEVPGLLAYRGLPMLLRSLEKRFDEAFVRKLDDMQKARIARSRQIIVALEAGIPGLKDLSEKVTEAAERGWLKAIDGSRIHVRKKHAALNALLQSAGAITCKLWMVRFHRALAAEGLRDGVDFKQTLWVHDELQFTHRPGLGPTLREIGEREMVATGVQLGLRGRYRTEGKTGGNWAECH